MNADEEAAALMAEEDARRGWAPKFDLTHPVPKGYAVKGVSTLYGPDGSVLSQWVKTKEDFEHRLEAIKEAAAELAEKVPRLPPLAAPALAIDSLATVYTITDAHVGMLAWREETGEDWDLKIAENTLRGCYESLVSSAPASGLGVVAQLGDFLHQDGLGAVTPTSGHLLDADGRFTKVVRIAVRILRRMVDVALMKHATVLVLMKEGNHDIASSVWLRTLFAALYENEPRVKVVDSPLPYYAYQHGQTMLAWHHAGFQRAGFRPGRRGAAR
jgi:hypothetical protein